MLKLVKEMEKINLLSPIYIFYFRPKVAQTSILEEHLRVLLRPKCY